MTPRIYQYEDSVKATNILKEHSIVYLAMQERIGKSLIALMVCENFIGSNILIVTKKGKPLENWETLLNEYKHCNTYKVTNYHQVKKLKADYDLVILDESHNYIGGTPKLSLLHSQVKKVVGNSKVIFLSATPYAQGMHSLYAQFKTTNHSPFTQETFYAWHRVYGIPDTIKLFARTVETYKKSDKVKILNKVGKLFLSRTRMQCGFIFEPKDNLHYVDLSPETTKAYNILLKDKIINFSSFKDPLVCDTTLKLRLSLHMLEGGTAKIDSNYVQLKNIEKIKYIKDKWGDTNDTVIMYHYKAELPKLQEYFKEVKLLQAVTNAEGIDLFDIKNLIIYSQDFSTAKYTQRRARQTNMSRTTDINVNFILVKKAISDQAYKTVALNKINFVDSLFKEEYL